MIWSRRNAGIAAVGAIFLIGVTACASGESGEPDSAGGEPAAAASGDMASQEGAIYEVRNYHFDPARFDEYAQIARGEYLRYLREHLDIVGFWVESGIPAEVRGAEQDELGSANITWVIRWASKAERDEKLPGGPRHARMEGDLRRSPGRGRELPEGRVPVHGVALLTMGAPSAAIARPAAVTWPAAITWLAAVTWPAARAVSSGPAGSRPAGR
ncbi:hypothetical protein [Candidatus Palauibacter sp.]|uniref:hypothetical protein n=1 Tax=Candidatus Palauibacter sp. TaxID=3101350 RepID=UPI003B013A7B